MSAAPRLEIAPPHGAPPVPSPPQRHLELVPPPPEPVDDEARRLLRSTRWLAALLAVVTIALFGLWTAAMLGATDSAWWPAVFGVVSAGVVAFGIVVVHKTR